MTDTWTNIDIGNLLSKDNGDVLSLSTFKPLESMPYV